MGRRAFFFLRKLSFFRKLQIHIISPLLFYVTGPYKIHEQSSQRPPTITVSRFQKISQLRRGTKTSLFLPVTSIVTDIDIVQLIDVVWLRLETWLTKLGVQCRQDVADGRAVDRLNTNCKPIAKFFSHCKNERLLHALYKPHQLTICCFTLQSLSVV